jgi:hypothetical protein
VTANLYCTRGDVNGLASAGEIEGASRVAFSALASTDVITLNGHGLETDQPLMVRAAEGGTLPAPLSEDTTYYAIRISNAKFKLAAAPAGAAINLTTDGASVVVVKEPPYDAVIEEWSRWADGFLPAHVVPLANPLSDEYALIRRLVAKLSAYELFRLDGKRSETFEAVKLDAVKAFDRFGKGIPVRVTTGARANLAATITTTAADTRGWGTGTIP